MAIQIGATKDFLANQYAGNAPDGTLFSGAPATDGSATNELSGGSPAFARKALGWSNSTGGAGQVTGGATFDVGAGKTVDHVGVCGSAVLGTADIRDTASVTSQAFASQGTYQVSVTFTQS